MDDVTEILIKWIHETQWPDKTKKLVCNCTLFSLQNNLATNNIIQKKKKHTKEDVHEYLGIFQTSGIKISFIRFGKQEVGNKLNLTSNNLIKASKKAVKGILAFPLISMSVR